MNFQGRIVLCTLAGIAAGLLTWFVSDVSGLVRIADDLHALTPEQLRQQQIVCMVFGGLIGALLSIADRLASGAARRMGAAAGIGLLVGAVAGLVGLMLGSAVFRVFYVVDASNPFAFLLNVLARAAGWGLIGALAGTADGWRKMSFRVGRNGFIGGLIGGVIGGILFELLPYVFVFLKAGILSRLVGFVVTGAFIGFFVALVQQLLKEAWIRVILGRNEGREYLVEKAETRIGRSELSDVPLFGDTAIARTHATVAARSDGRYVLRDAGSQTGTLVNDAKVEGEVALQDGDRIQIGTKTLVFHERLTRQRSAPTAKDVAPPRAASTLPPLADSLPPLGMAGTPRGNGLGNNGGSSAGRFSADNNGAGPRIVIVAGPHAGNTFALGTMAVIGRDPQSDVPLSNDTKTSRRHARLLREGTAYIIEDTGSTNGTFVNGQKVTRQALAPGDTVLVGSTALRIE